MPGTFQPEHSLDGFPDIDTRDPFYSQNPITRISSYLRLNSFNFVINVNQIAELRFIRGCPWRINEDSMSMINWQFILDLYFLPE